MASYDSMASGTRRGVLTIFGLLTLAAVAAAQTVSPQDVEDYLGTWKLAASFQGTPVELVLEIVDDDGLVRAAVGSAMAPEPQLVETITRTEEGLLLAYTADFGGNALGIQVRAAREGEGLVGTFGDNNGLFSTDFTGERAAEPAAIVAAAARAAAEAAEAPPPQRRRRRAAEAKLDLGSGKELRMLHGELELGSPDHDSLLATAPGDVWSYSYRTMKLLTDADLVFGDT
ncbi:MAG: hypothetical protein R3190_04495, partial [Thermoanaerobaculia bacterium]|nr:hypothetical protein [Thermoanaerobaculia bacterium]